MIGSCVEMESEATEIVSIRNDSSGSESTSSPISGLFGDIESEDTEVASMRESASATELPSPSICVYLISNWDRNVIFLVRIAGALLCETCWEYMIGL